MAIIHLKTAFFLPVRVGCGDILFKALGGFGWLGSPTSLVLWLLCRLLSRSVLRGEKERRSTIADMNRIVISNLDRILAYIPYHGTHVYRHVYRYRDMYTEIQV